MAKRITYEVVLSLTPMTLGQYLSDKLLQAWATAQFNYGKLDFVETSYNDVTAVHFFGEVTLDEGVPLRESSFWMFRHFQAQCAADFPGVKVSALWQLGKGKILRQEFDSISCTSAEEVSCGRN